MYTWNDIYEGNVTFMLMNFKADVMVCNVV